MQFLYVIKTALAALIAHRSRSFLTVLGIVIGITSIIMVMSIGSAAEAIIVGELGGLGAETVVVRPGKEPSGPTDFAESLFGDSLKDRELEALGRKQNIPNAIGVAPEILVPGGSISFEGETFRPVILGFSAEFMRDSLGLQLSDGIFFDETDIHNKARVAIIGGRVKDELFGTSDPIGKSITIKGNKFRVVGVFEKRGQVVFFDVDELVLVPYTAAQAFLTGNNYYNQIIVRADSPESVDRVVFDIQATLRALHNIDDPADDDFYVQTQQGLVEQVSTIIGIFTTFLTFVVAIALVVGGIGVMNIMLVSVTERTREIGLRKAVGATDSDIMSQFLVEAVFLTGFGGVIGIFLGTVLSFIVGFILSQFVGLAWQFVFPVSAALLGLLVSSGVGVVFGLYPARQASRKSPIEALRYE
ncbi:MAG: ABC transporter permease [bacterium]|nr:ABC transporter permease [bacterium]